jgi:molecular chaperone DnaJ
MAKDYYEILGVPRTADKDEIKRAFRALARKLHPDVNKAPDAEAKFKEINEAYEVLSDDEKRARFDRFGADAVNGPAGYGRGGPAPGDFSNFEEIFEDFFSGFGGVRTGRRRGPRPGQDRRVDVNIAFRDAYFGVEKEIEFDRQEVCTTCSGHGAVQQTFLGPMVQVTTCPRCGGRGETIPTPCTNCRGTGRVRRRATLSVPIPAGVRDGVQIQITGEGDAGDLNAPNGNLYIVVHVQEHEFFKRRDNDIIVEININMAQAALGDRVNVPTADGEVELTIDAGTQNGRVYRLRGKGFPRLRSIDGTSSGSGDQLVYVNVEIPRQLNERQRQLLQELGASFGKAPVQPQPNGKNFIDRLKDLFTPEGS